MVTGICYFDRAALSDERRADLAALHPVRSPRGSESPFTLFADGDAIRVTGRLEAPSTDQFARLLDINPVDGPLVVDLSATEFDHHAVHVLDQAASAERPVRVRTRRTARDLLSLLGRDAPHVRFEFIDGNARAGSRPSGVVPTCADCGVVIGAYEPAMIVVNGNSRKTSRAAEPDAVAAASELFHRDCHAKRRGSRAATNNGARLPDL